MKKHFVPFLIFFTISSALSAQMITGVWQGKIDRKKVELKIIQKGDSLTGTSYYYESPTNYRRYSIKGYFDKLTNEAVWWDDQLIEEKIGKPVFGSPGKTPYISSADFNCPGSGKMLLDGNAALKENPEKIKGPVDLQKTVGNIFNDEWDFIIDNYTAGGNDPYLIDSIEELASVTDKITIPPAKIPERDIVIANPNEKPVQKSNPHAEEPKSTVDEKMVFVPPFTIEDKFRTRKKIFTSEIPVTGDSIELRFYDNAEIDGDSISLFLNDKLIFEHIRLAATAYIIKLPVSELKETNELIMVAENLGEIPPNTSYMIALVGNKRYDANLASTEHSSAVIRLVKSRPVLQ